MQVKRVNLQTEMDSFPLTQFENNPVKDILP